MNRWTSTTAVLLAIAAGLFLSATDPIRADDDKPKSDEKPPTQQPAEPEKPKEKSLLEKLGEDLMKEEDDSLLGGGDPAKEQADKMERAVKGMRSAGDKLDGGKTADETQKIQKQVIKDLEDIINQLENPPPDQSGGGGGGGGGSSSNSKSGGGGGSSSSRRRQSGGGSSMRLNRPQGGSGQKRGSAKQHEQQADEVGGTSSENASDSSKQTQAARKAAEEEARRRKLEMDIWGHLPTHLREELLSTYGERMLPKYEQLVKQFYEALSTQGDAKKK